MNMKAVAGICVGVLCSWGVREALKPSIEEEIAAMCVEVNKQMPMMADEETRCDSLTQGAGKAFTYNYTMINIAKSDLDMSAAKEALEPFIEERRHSPEMQKFFEKGIKVSVSYKDKNGLPLFDFTMDH